MQRAKKSEESLEEEPDGIIRATQCKDVESQNN